MGIYPLPPPFSPLTQASTRAQPHPPLTHHFSSLLSYGTHPSLGLSRTVLRHRHLAHCWCVSPPDTTWTTTRHSESCRTCASLTRRASVGSAPHPSNDVVTVLGGVGRHSDLWRRHVLICDSCPANSNPVCTPTSPSGAHPPTPHALPSTDAGCFVFVEGVCGVLRAVAWLFWGTGWDGHASVVCQSLDLSVWSVGSPRNTLPASKPPIPPLSPHSCT